MSAGPAPHHRSGAMQVLSVRIFPSHLKALRAYAERKHAGNVSRAFNYILETVNLIDDGDRAYTAPNKGQPS